MATGSSRTACSTEQPGTTALDKVWDTVNNKVWDMVVGTVWADMVKDIGLWDKAVDTSTDKVYSTVVLEACMDTAWLYNSAV